MKHEPLSFAEFAALYESVSRLPEPLNDVEFLKAIEANTPESLRASKREVRVLVSVWVNADGSVRGARAILPEAPSGVTVRGIKTDENGRYLGDIPRASADPECMEAAERAALVMRFSPAQRDGQPVEFPDLRIGASFSGFTPRKLDSRGGS